jgi:hypothetical protein
MNQKLKIGRHVEIVPRDSSELASFFEPFEPSADQAHLLASLAS